MKAPKELPLTINMSGSYPLKVKQCGLT